MFGAGREAVGTKDGRDDELDGDEGVDGVGEVDEEAGQSEPEPEPEPLPEELLPDEETEGLEDDDGVEPEALPLSDPLPLPLPEGLPDDGTAEEDELAPDPLPLPLPEPDPLPEDGGLAGLEEGLDGWLTGTAELDGYEIRADPEEPLPDPTLLTGPPTFAFVQVDPEHLV